MIPLLREYVRRESFIGWSYTYQVRGCLPSDLRQPEDLSGCLWHVRGKYLTYLTTSVRGKSVDELDCCRSRKGVLTLALRRIRMVPSYNVAPSTRSCPLAAECSQ